MIKLANILRFILPFVLTGLLCSFKSYDYKAAWNNVLEVGHTKPQSAIKMIKKINKQAEADKNMQQQLQCIMMTYRYNDKILSYREESKICLKELNAFLAKQTDPVMVAMTRYFLARTYRNFYYEAGWRSDLQDTIPADVSEWPRRLVADTMKSLTMLALNEPALRKAKSKDYEQLLFVTADTRQYRPTLYDVIANDAVEDILVGDSLKLQVVADVVKFHKTDIDRSAYVKASMWQITKMYNSGTFSERRNKRIAGLRQLLEEEKTAPASNLVRIELTDLLCDELEDDNKDVSPKEIVQICNEGIAAYPKQSSVKELQRTINYINRERLSVKLVNEKQPVHEGDKIKLKVSYANIKDLTLTLQRYDCTPEDWLKKHYEQSALSKVADYNFTLKPSDYCVMQDTTLELPAQELGAYRIGSADGYVDIVVSNYFVLDFKEKGDLQLFVVDSKNGAPQQKVTAQLKCTIWENHEDKEIRDTAISNEQGFISFEEPGYNDSLLLKSGKDRFFFCEPDVRYNNSDYVDDDTEIGERLAILTDRSIYRPGQTVHFKVIAYKNSPLGKLYKDEKLEIKVKDANGEKIKTFTLRTDNFGAVADSFVLPSVCRPGKFTISVDGNHRYGKNRWSGNADAKCRFQVEEYKRPTFDITLPRPSGIYTFGDTVKVKGTAAYLMGASVQNAKVHYRVNRGYCYYWWLNDDDRSDVVEGDTVTDENGEFTIFFIPTKKTTRKTCHLYRVETTITDANGETHAQTAEVMVGDDGLVILCPRISKLPFQELLNQKFWVANINNIGVDRQVTYTFSREGREVAKGTVMSNNDKGFTLPIITKEWQSGRYKIVLSVTDDRQQLITRELDVVLYRNTDSLPPIECDLWTEGTGEREVEKGDTVKVRVGTTLHDAHLLVVEVNDKGESKKQWVDLDNEIKTLKYVLSTGFKSQVQFYLVHDGELKEDNLELTQKLPERLFPVQLSVFRDKVQPGTKQHWRITIPTDSMVVDVKGFQLGHANKKDKKHHSHKKHKKHKKSVKVSARARKSPVQVLASMYDASLDQISSDKIQKHRWEFYPEFQYDIDFHGWGTQFMSSKSYKYTTNSYYGRGSNSFEDDKWTYQQKIEPDIKYDDSLGGVCKSSTLYAACAGVTGSHSVMNIKALKPSKTSEVASCLSQEKEENETCKVRRNFSETAFFYPDLYADKKGNVTLDFTLPESLTKWKLMVLAHGMAKDKNGRPAVLRYGKLIKEIVSQQDFMISPNYPRFLRQGDHSVFTAKIINLSDKEQKGVATVEWLDPVTERVVAKRDTTFDVAAHQNGVVEWTLDVPHNTEALLMRVSAKGANLADAEQQLLPVLTDRVVLTQTLPMFVRGGQTKQYELKNLVENNSATLSSRFLKLDMTTNPVWDVIQCLPALTGSNFGNAITYSSAYYALQTAQSIVKANPRISNIIKEWQQQSGNEKTLLSNLMKNEEVKQVLLTETPWVMEAKNETQRKERLALLVKMDSLRLLSDRWNGLLQDCRNNDDGYSWYTGMPSSEYVTLYVLDNYGRLRQNGIKEGLYDYDIRSSLRYLDKIQFDRYQNLRKEKKLDKTRLSSLDLYYLQVRSLFTDGSGFKIDNDYKEAYDYFYRLAKLQWNVYGLYRKAMAATVLFRGGDTLEARKVVASLREYATTSDEMGMYWPSNNSTWLWEDDAIATHTAIMEALQLVDANQEEQDNLRIWLLNQKHLQDWGNTISTVDAFHVLLDLGSNWVINDNNVTIKQGGDLVNMDKKEAGTGYFSQTISGKEVTSDKARVELSCEAGGNIAFGGLYWQFEEYMDKVKQGTTGLSVDKMVTLKVSSNGEEALKPVKEGTLLKVGDQLVMRLTVRADRDFEYVMLKDQRASCLEPVQTLSGYHYAQGVGYYQSVKDASMCFFFEHLPKGTYVFEYPVYVTHRGSFSNGITSLQCLYAPEYSANTGSVRIKVEGK